MQRFRVGILSFAALVILAAAPAHAAVLKLGHVLPPAHNWHVAATGFADEVKTATQGRVEIKVFPNPAHEFVSVSNIKGKTMQVRINGLSGQTVLETKVKGQATLDISNLAPGIYFVVCTTNDTRETIKLVKP